MGMLLAVMTMIMVVVVAVVVTMAMLHGQIRQPARNLVVPRDPVAHIPYLPPTYPRFFLFSSAPWTAAPSAELRHSVADSLWLCQIAVLGL